MAPANVSEYFEEIREVIEHSQIVSPTEHPLVVSDDGCANFHNQLVKKRAAKTPRKMWVEKPFFNCASRNLTSRNQRKLGEKMPKTKKKSAEEESFDRRIEKLNKRRAEKISLFSYLTFLVPKKDQANATYAFIEHLIEFKYNNYPQYEGFAGFKSIDWPKAILLSIPI